MLRIIGAIYITKKEIYVNRGVVNNIENADGLFVSDGNNIYVLSLANNSYSNYILEKIEKEGSL